MPVQIDSEELLHLIALTYVPGIGPVLSRALLTRFGCATNVFKASLKDLKHTDGLTETKVKGFRDPEVMKLAAAELGFVIKNGVTVLGYGSDHYPKRLEHCSDAPAVLFFKGDANLNTKKVVAIVGTRKNTDYGHKLCEELVQGLQQLDDILIVSGLALGIDAVAHKMAVQLGLPTVGALGHGLDKMYPFTHKQLAAQMMENGGVLSEYTSDTTASQGNFPMRNRIVAGISDVTVVVESNISGGALIAAAAANAYNREVAAYPGRVTDSRSAGCNELIRKNAAAMITGADDLIEMMGWGTKGKRKPVQQQLFINLTEHEQKIISFLQARESAHADELFYHTGLQSSLLASTLLQLEMQGLIRSLPGKHYKVH